LLFRYNAFPGMTAAPEVVTAINRRVDLETLASFINKTVQAQVLTPDEELERFIREMADFPAPAIAVAGVEGENTIIPAEAPEDEGTPSEEQAGPPSKTGQKEEVAAHARRGKDRFARGLSGYNSATDAYQQELRNTYEGWVDEVDGELRGMTTTEARDGLQERWRELLLLGLLLLKRRGWERLSDAFAQGYGGRSFSPLARERLEAELRSNDRYLEEHLWAKVTDTISLMQLQQIVMLHAGGQHAAAVDLLQGALFSVRANVGLYAGAFWRAIWVGSSVRMEEVAAQTLGAGPAVRWNLDALAKHCPTCLAFGNRRYPDMAQMLAFTGGALPGAGTECDGNCRCWLTKEENGAWVLL
jgi:hypothetical protein